MGFSLHHAADRLSTVVRAVPADALTRPTPCPEYSIADLLDHIDGLSVAFTLAAHKELDPARNGASVDGSRLNDDWSELIPEHLSALATAWDEPAAWVGESSAGGVTMPADMTALVALDELVVHTWDLAQATDQEFVVDPGDLAILHDFVASWAEPSQADMRGNIFGPIVEVPVFSSLADKVVALTGRRPEWSAAAS